MSVYLGNQKILKACADFSGSVQTEGLSVTPAKNTQIKTPTAGKYFNQVIVTAIPDSYVQPEGVLEVGANGVYDVTDKKSVSVNVAAATEGTALDIEYGLTPPTNTDRLWIKAEEPAKLKVDYTANGFDVVSIDEFLVIQGKKFNYTTPCASVGNTIYLFGDLITPSSGVTKINVANGTYEFVDMALFEGCQNAAIAVMHTTIYLCANDGKLYAFNTLSDTLTYVAQLDVPEMANCIAYNDYLYFVGGVKSGTSDAVNTFKRYKPSTNELTSLANLYEPIKRTFLVQHGGYFYLFGGLIKKGYSDKIFRYDFKTERWYQMSETLPEGICGLNGVMHGDDLYLLMGEYSNTRIWKYNFADKTIIECDKATRYNYNVASAQIGNDFYCIGAYDGTCGFIDKVYKMSMDVALEANTVYIAQGDNGRKVKIISGAKELYIKVRNVYKGDGSGKAQYLDAYYHNGTNWVNINTKEVYAA